MDLTPYFSKHVVPLGVDGLKILDLGSLSGKDCWVAHDMVGEKGNVVAICETDADLEKNLEILGNKNSGKDFDNLQFTVGSAEDLDDCGLEMDSADIVIANGAFGRCENKDKVLQQCHNVLHVGGELHFADMFTDRRLHDEVYDSDLAPVQDLMGAVYIEDFKRAARNIGFIDPRVLESSIIDVTDYATREVVGNVNFFRIRWRLFKVPSLETLCEDYGQVATYNGGCPGYESGYPLDDHHFLETHKPMLVCGNSASMVEETWLKKYFTVTGNRNVHYGLFPC